jgi:hypothetical protein
MIRTLGQLTDSIHESEGIRKIPELISASERIAAPGPPDEAAKLALNCDVR